jgi:alkanesulfonate monooxygenase SsuD/methylene tetrahydromethanopterin reductase-like flavin-dependent oxidoreductase (luciferase family)
MQLSMWISFDRAWEEALDRARWAEAHGFAGFWVADHYMPNTGDLSVVDGPGFECWTMLTAIGVAVPGLRLVSMVSPLTVHHPALLARRVMTTDHVTGGRAVLGIGAGWQINEHHAYGWDLPSPKERVDRFEEGIEIIHRLFREERVTFDGASFTIREAPFQPKPVQTPLPILVGTGSPRMMRIAARWADQWNTWGDPGLIAERREQFARACDAVGRDVATVHTSCQANVFLVDDERAAKLRDRITDRRALIGGPNEITELIGQYGAMGVDELAIPDFTLGNTAEQRAEGWDRFADEVMSQLPS